MQEPAAASRVAAELEALIAREGNANLPLSSGRLPLVEVLEHGTIKQAKALLRLGADPRIEHKGSTALVAAEASANANVLRRYRNNARKRSEQDALPLLGALQLGAAPDPVHCIVFDRSADVVAGFLKSTQGWKVQRSVEGKVVFLERRQAFLFDHARCCSSSEPRITSGTWREALLPSG